jgi:hypothetical protein
MLSLFLSILNGLPLVKIIDRQLVIDIHISARQIDSSGRSGWGSPGQGWSFPQVVHRLYPEIGGPITSIIGEPPINDPLQVLSRLEIWGD